MAVYTHCCRAQPLRQLGFLVYIILILASYRCTHSHVQVSWLGVQVGGHLALFYIRQMDRMKSRNGCAMMTVT